MIITPSPIIIIINYNNYDDNVDDNDIVDDDDYTKSTSVADGQWQDLRPAPATQFQEDQQVFCILYFYLYLLF